MLTRAAWCDVRRVLGADRLDPAGTRRRTPDPGQDSGGDAGLRRIAIVQRGQPVARVGPLDAHVHHPQSILGAEGLYGIR